MTNEPRTEWLDLREVAKELQTTTATLLNMAREGEFPEVLLVHRFKKLVRRDIYEIWKQRRMINPESHQRATRKHDLASLVRDPETCEPWRRRRASGN